MTGKVWRFLLLVGLCIAVAPAGGHAQFTREHDITSLRGFHGSATRIRRSFQSDDEARSVFKQVLARWKGSNKDETLVDNPQYATIVRTASADGLTPHAWFFVDPIELVRLQHKLIGRTIESLVAERSGDVG